MSWVVTRLELDGTETVVGCADSERDFQIIMAADRDNIDYEAVYHFNNTEEGAEK